MYCSRCGNKVESNEKYCRNCGEIIESDLSNYYPENYNYNYSNITDEKLKEAYVGTNYETIAKENFSVPALFFGVYYLFYRKMYLYGIILLAVITGITILYPDITAIGLIISILVGIFFNKVYLQEVTKRVEKIKNVNSDKTKEEILEICKKKGGTNIAIPIILVFSIAVVAFIGIETYMYIKNDKINITNNELKITKGNDSINDLAYTIPDGFTVGKYNSSSYKSYSTNYCRFSITSYGSSIYNNADEYLNKNIYASNSDQVSEIDTKKVNNMDWRYLTITSSYRKNYHYATIYNNKIYTIEYSENQDNNDCTQSYNKFIESLKFIDNGITKS